MSSLKLLFDDPDRYQDVYRNGFARIAMKDVVLERVTQHFDNHIVKQLTEAFAPDDQFSSLGVGVGEGPHELHFLQTLASHFTSLRNVAVDPNETLLETFRSNVASWNSDTSSKHEFHWFNGPLSKFLDESPLATCQYNLISAIHSMYHTGDIETTFTRLASLLKDRGMMIIVLSECRLLKQTVLQKRWLPASSRFSEKSLPGQICKVAQEKGYTVTTLDLNIKWDLTELFDENSELGDRLVDFLTTTAYFRQTAQPEKLDELMSFWRTFCSEDEDGRIRTLADETMILISK